MNSKASRFVVSDLNDVVYVLDRSGTVLSRRGLLSKVRSFAVAGNPGIIVAVGDEKVMYVMDTQTNLLWTHTEIGSSRFNVQTSQDGKRILLGILEGYNYLG